MRLICLQLFIIVTLSLRFSFGQGDGVSNPRMAPCTYDSDCITNAYCKDQSYCQCKVLYIFHRRPDKTFACLKEADAIGDECEVAIQCTKPFGVDAACYHDACQCRAGAHFKERRCYETAMLGDKCKVKNNCKINSNIPVFCDRSTCVCPQKYHPNSMNTDCVESKYIGEQCVSNDHCLIENSYCADVCRCKIGYIASQDEQRCLKAAENEGDHCEEPAQCNVFLQKMRCLKGMCICEEGYHTVPPDNVCWRSISVGDQCDDNRQCVVTSNNPQAVSCAQGKCQCSPGFVTDTEDPKNCISRTGGGQGQILPHLVSIASFLLLLLINTFTRVT